jgi:hypothetical protein
MGLNMAAEECKFFLDGSPKKEQFDRISPFQPFIFAVLMKTRKLLFSKLKLRLEQTIHILFILFFYILYVSSL